MVLEINIRNLSRTRTEEEEYLFTAQQQLEKAKVDEALAQVEARKAQRQKQLEMSSRRNQAQADELNKLYEQRAKLVVDPDVEPDELKHLDEQINRLEKEVLSSSLEDAENSLNILEPKRDWVKSNLAFEEQISLPSSQNNPGSNSSNHTSIPNQDNQ